MPPLWQGETPVRVAGMGAGAGMDGLVCALLWGGAGTRERDKEGTMTKNLDQLRERASHPKALHGCSSEPCGSVVCQTARDRDTLLDRVEAAEESHRLANVMLRTVLEEMGSGPETDPIIKVRQLVARAEVAEAAVQRVEALCMTTDGDPIDPDFDGNTVGDIRRALDGG